MSVDTLRVPAFFPRRQVIQNLVQTKHEEQTSVAQANGVPDRLRRWEAGRKYFAQRRQVVERGSVWCGALGGVRWVPVHAKGAMPLKVIVEVDVITVGSRLGLMERLPGSSMHQPTGPPTGIRGGYGGFCYESRRNQVSVRHFAQCVLAGRARQALLSEAPSHIRVPFCARIALVCLG